MTETTAPTNAPRRNVFVRTWRHLAGPAGAPGAKAFARRQAAALLLGSPFYVAIAFVLEPIVWPH